MDVWFEENIVKETRKEYDIKGIKVRGFTFETNRKTKGIRIPLKNNGILLRKFKALSRTYKVKATFSGKKVKNYKLTPFSDIGRQESGLSKIFPLMGFYVLEDFIIFTDERCPCIEKVKSCYPNDDPEKRLKLFVEYYGKKFNLIKETKNE